MGNDLRYQYEAGAAKETDLDFPSDDFTIDKNL